MSRRDVVGVTAGFGRTKTRRQTHIKMCCLGLEPQLEGVIPGCIFRKSFIVHFPIGGVPLCHKIDLETEQKYIDLH